MQAIVTTDVRTDSVTRPTDAMRAAMAAAAGDRQNGQEPITNQLQRRMAEMLGKEAALWMPSGTTANQVALQVLTHPGDEVITARASHIGSHQAGAALHAGIQIVEIGRQPGTFTLDELAAAIKPAAMPVSPTTKTRAWTTPWTSSSTAGLANGQRTADLCSTSCSAMPKFRTTTDPGSNTDRSSASRSRCSSVGRDSRRRIQRTHAHRDNEKALCAVAQVTLRYVSALRRPPPGPPCRTLTPLALERQVRFAVAMVSRTGRITDAVALAAGAPTHPPRRIFADYAPSAIRHITSSAGVGLNRWPKQRAVHNYEGCVGKPRDHAPGRRLPIRNVDQT